MLRSLLMLLVLGFSFTVLAQEPGSEEEKAAMAAWMKHMTPGPVHQHLAEAVGKWKTSITFWPGPGAPEMKSEGTAEYTMVLGGRYLQGVFKGLMMGMPFEGMGMTAYDNSKKELQTTWIDNLGTSLTMFTGTYDETTKTETYTGKMYEPSQGKDLNVKSVTHYEGKDKIIFTMYMVDGDKESKSMEIVHTRN